MLVLARKQGQKIILKTKDGEIIITVLENRSGNTVRLGVEAPKEIAVYRAEIYNPKDAA